MKKSTRQIMRILLDADDTIPVEHKAAIWEVVTNRPRNDASLPLLLNQQQVADLLGVSRHTIRRLVKGGQLPTVRVLEACRYRRSDVEEFVRRGSA
ncbi:MAG: helix-turn-helix domain-containing protein [Lentisphaerae bacterium]|nr:helix-turn-helix domain-containing protein [Lentisphaerota bacterium]